VRSWHERKLSRCPARRLFSAILLQLLAVRPVHEYNISMAVSCRKCLFFNNLQYQINATMGSRTGTQARLRAWIGSRKSAACIRRLPRIKYHPTGSAQAQGSRCQLHRRLCPAFWGGRAAIIPASLPVRPDRPPHNLCTQSVMPPYRCPQMRHAIESGMHIGHWGSRRK
jgi:hypothetical protein